MSHFRRTDDETNFALTNEHEVKDFLVFDAFDVFPFICELIKNAFSFVSYNLYTIITLVIALTLVQIGITRFHI